MIKTYYIDKDERDLMVMIFNNLKSNPYSSYENFKKEVTATIENFLIDLKALLFFKEISESRKNGNDNVFLIKNCPIDENLPEFNHNDSLNDKYTRKASFVAEAFLEVFAQYTDNPILAYDTRSNGDFFHDVYAQDQYKNTQTQKTDSELYLHNDRTAHPIRADYLNLLGMRCSPKNQITTSYIDGKDVLELLTENQQIVLREKYFCTPYDEYSRDSNKSQIDSYAHSILSEEYSLRYYETRTRPLPEAPIEAYDAYIAFRNAIIKAKKVMVDIQKNDLFSFPNQFGLHSRTFINITDRDEAKKRWLLKTYAFRNTNYMQKFSPYFDKSLPGLVVDSLVLSEVQ